ncbi:UvrD-helicase domain-containing protein [Candidatus Gottesmanbacteria bacterium]|nr:UvrD-helicase domain-containing protein [Candidatus Gottesmanbacteria bacterium]
MTDSFLRSLNKDQYQAVTQITGPVIVLAGAGSGKTRVLTYKVAHLILDKKVDPQNILMVTFTNKAAGEMKSRIEKLVGKNLSPMAATFHSFAARLLRREGYNIGIPINFVIYDQQDQLEAIKTVMQSMSLNSKTVNPKSVLNTISQAKNELIDAADYIRYARGFFQETVARIYPVYQEFLKKNSALDFDDLLTETVKFLKDSPKAAFYQDQYKYITIDEYQDTNKAQYEISKLLAKTHKNICIVGDAAQSIYSWRGADYQNIGNFQRDFDPVKIIYLEQNYRSTQKILESARSVVSHNTSHPILKLWTTNGDGNDLSYFEAESEQEEALYVLSAINKLVSDSKNIISLSDVAVLYRTNAQSRVIEEALLHSAIPYKIVGAVRFYDRKEIKDLLSYLKFIANPKDSVALSRIGKIGKRRQQLFIEVFEEITSKVMNKFTTLDILDTVVKKTDYLSLFDLKDEQDKGRLENIKELRSVATQFDNLNDFLENVALVEQEYLPSGKPTKFENNAAVNLLTIHAAKGLEFKAVFIIGMEEGLFPHSQALMDRVQMEEERRLAYVAITRAKNHLYLTSARRRLFFGKTTNNLPSRFLGDIPQDFLQMIQLIE